MAKQQVINMENGSTLIYQKQKSFNGTSFVIGFRSGCQLDGKYLGLSHLLEHLLFDGTTEDLTKNIHGQILKHTIRQNAFTSPSCIASTFSATNNHLEKALDNVMHTLTKKEFTKEQIRKEVEVVKQEIYLKRESARKVEKTANSDLMSTILEIPPHEPTHILGNEKTLKMITPELLVKYMDRYFNLDNLVISVTSNKPLEEIIELLEEKVYPKFKNATDEKYIVPYDEVTALNPQNYFFAYPNNNSKTVDINIVLKERENAYADNINKEFAYDMIEEYLMNSLGGIMYEKLRISNSLTYASYLSNANLGLGKLKLFRAITNKSKMRQTIKVLCTMMREIGENGFPREKFEDVKKALTDLENADLKKFKPCSAEDNFEDFMEGVDFIDYKAVMKYIKEMTYEEFNTYVSGIYKQAKVSLAIDGDFDSRDCYSLIEVEEMLGNYANKQYKAQLNAPIMQYTTPSGNLVDMIQLIMDPTGEEEGEIPKTVTIDDQSLFIDLIEEEKKEKKKKQTKKEPTTTNENKDKDK